MFEVRELRFGKQAPHLNATKLAEGIFKFMGGWVTGSSGWHTGLWH